MPATLAARARLLHLVMAARPTSTTRDLRFGRPAPSALSLRPTRGPTPPVATKPGTASATRRPPTQRRHPRHRDLPNQPPRVPDRTRTGRKSHNPRPPKRPVEPSNDDSPNTVYRRLNNDHHTPLFGRCLTQAMRSRHPAGQRAEMLPAGFHGSVEGQQLSRQSCGGSDPAGNTRIMLTVVRDARSSRPSIGTTLQPQRRRAQGGDAGPYHTDSATTTPGMTDSAATTTATRQPLR